MQNGQWKKKGFFYLCVCGTVSVCFSYLLWVQSNVCNKCVFIVFNTYKIVAYCAIPKEISFIWQMNTLATARKRAVPSMFMLHPIGRTKRVTRLSIRRGPSIARNVTGRAAALEVLNLSIILCVQLRPNGVGISGLIKKIIMIKWMVKVV